MGKRKYTKKSDYWQKFEKNKGSQNTFNSSAPLQPIQNLIAPQQEDYSPELVGDNLLSSVGSKNEVSFASSVSTRVRRNKVATSPINNRFANIEGGLIPYDFSDDHISNNDAITLTYKAYFNVPTVKSTIDIMSEFANSDLYLKGGTEKSKKFVKSWLEKVNVEKLKEQFFLEFYRSGNVFMWRLDSKLTDRGVRSVVRTGIANTAKASAELPVRYLLLNPTEILARDALFFDDNVYVKLLTGYEILKLKNPKTEEEQTIYNALPEEIKKIVSNPGAASTKDKVYLELDPRYLHAVFYKKQDYEPLSIPMCFCVLDDINKKMELKKVDQAIARSIENVILLITMGAEPDKGGVNHKNLQAMQDLFRNTSVGRVLVADYTTKADFVIPDMKKVLGKEKYEVLNDDIRDGLQNIMLGDSKYADASMKLRVFYQRLDEARDVFLRDFLQPEINRVCKEFGLVNPPIAHFTKLDTMDNEHLQKLVTRMVELGVLSPEQGMSVIHTGVFPTAEELDEAQEKYKKQREEGKFVPIMSNINERQIEQQEDQFEMQLEQDDKHHEEDLKHQEKISKQNSVTNNGGPNNNPSKKATQRSQVKNQKQAGGRPVGANGSIYSIQSIRDTVEELEDFYSEAQKIYKGALNLKRLTKKKKNIILDICENIITAKDKKDWVPTLQSICDDNTKLLSLSVMSQVEDISNEHSLDTYCASILYHSLAKKV